MPSLLDPKTAFVFSTWTHYYFLILAKSPPKMRKARLDRAEALKILRLHESADRSKIDAAYRKWRKEYHPDNFQYLGEEFRILAEEHYKLVEMAYDTLSKP